MRRIVTGPASYLSGLARATARGWDAFFFTPADPTALGLIRLVVGLLALWSLFVYGLDFDAFFGPDGWADVATVRAVQAAKPPRAQSAVWSFWFAVPGPLLRPVWLACLVVLAMFALGLYSRLTAVLAWVIVVSTVRRLPVSLYGFDQHVSAWLLYLAVSGASGQSVSLDRFLARWKATRAEAARRRKDGRWASAGGAPGPSIAANLGLRLIQLHLCLVYGMAGMAKLQGRAWWDGSAVWGTLAAGEFRLFDLTWLAAFPMLLNFMTHVGLATEIGYPILIWVKPLRPLVLATVVALHVGIELTLGLGEFALAMIAGNLAFVPGGWLRSLVTGREPSPPADRLVYDGACPRCRASVALVVAADPGRLIEPVDLTAVDVSTVHPTLTRESSLKSMHLVRADGRVFAGYDAVTALCRRLPLFWGLGLAGSLPPVSTAGRRVYNRVAAGRPRDVTCSDTVCGPP